MSNVLQFQVNAKNLPKMLLSVEKYYMLLFVIYYAIILIVKFVGVCLGCLLVFVVALKFIPRIMIFRLPKSWNRDKRSSDRMMIRPSSTWQQ